MLGNEVWLKLNASKPAMALYECERKESGAQRNIPRNPLSRPGSVSPHCNPPIRKDLGVARITRAENSNTLCGTQSSQSGVPVEIGRRVVCDLSSSSAFALSSGQFNAIGADFR